MKDLINLLPPIAIKSRTRRIYLLRLGTVQRRILIAIGLIITVVVVAIVTLNLIKRDLRLDSLAIGAEANKTLIELTDTNRRLTLISAWKRDHEPWTPQLEDVFDIIPPGIELTEINTDEKEDRLEIKGVITSRDSVLAFQKELEALSWVEKLEAPLSNFQTGEGTNFQFILFRPGPPQADPLAEDNEVNEEE